jgi:hypothetical protein
MDGTSDTRPEDVIRERSLYRDLLDERSRIEIKSEANLNLCDLSPFPELKKAGCSIKATLYNRPDSPLDQYAAINGPDYRL